MKLPHKKTRSLPRVQGEKELYGLKILKVAAATNLVFQAYHLKQEQALLIAEYFADLHSKDNPLKEEANSLRRFGSELANTQKALEERAQLLIRLGDYIEQARKLEIATLEKQKESQNV